MICITIDPFWARKVVENIRWPPYGDLIIPLYLSVHKVACLQGVVIAKPKKQNPEKCTLYTLSIHSLINRDISKLKPLSASLGHNWLMSSTFMK